MAQTAESCSGIARPDYLLWSLLFLKGYSTEEGNSARYGVDEKTYRKWIWVFIEAMADLSEIKWDNRLLGDAFDNCRVSVDGTDFRICEPIPFDAKWYSHKFHGPGVRYEICVTIETGEIVWVNGPFSCGAWPDLKIYQRNLKCSLTENECAVADGGYNDPTCRKAGDTDAMTSFFAIVRARHEILNRRLKQFQVLQQRFRHALERHSDCFHAVANILHVAMEEDETLFDIPSPLI